MSGISRELLAKRVYEYLKDQLIARRLDRGTHLKSAEIASDLDVSRTTVRKAIGRLVEDGYVRLTEAGRPYVAALPRRGRGRTNGEFDFANQTENAYWSIFERVFRGQYRPGENIRGRELADELGVSLGTVRQALDWLSRDGLFVRVPRRGWRLISLSAQDIEDAYRFRLLLEPEALRRAMPTFDRGLLDRLLSQCRQAINSNQRANEYGLRRTDYSFHHAILQQAGSPILTNMLDPLIRKSMMVGVFQPVGHRLSARSFREHAEVLRAIAGRDETQAIAALRRHLERSLAVFLQKYRAGAPRGIGRSAADFSSGNGSVKQKPLGAGESAGV